LFRKVYGKLELPPSYLLPPAVTSDRTTRSS
jgi:hypothetical protein